MTGPGGFDELVTRFSAEVGEALTRATRAATDAAAAGDRFHSQTDHLAERTRSGALRPRRDELTDDDLRSAATGFRVDSGLPVADLPPGRELPAAGDDPEPPATEGTGETTRSSDVGPRRNDDDEDFSQERILRRR